MIIKSQLIGVKISWYQISDIREVSTGIMKLTVNQVRHHGNRSAQLQRVRTWWDQDRWPIRAQDAQWHHSCRNQQTLVSDQWRTRVSAASSAWTDLMVSASSGTNVYLKLRWTELDWWGHLVQLEAASWYQLRSGPQMLDQSCKQTPDQSKCSEHNKTFKNSFSHNVDLLFVSPR